MCGYKQAMKSTSRNDRSIFYSRSATYDAANTEREEERGRERGMERLRERERERERGRARERASEREEGSELRASRSERLRM